GACRAYYSGRCRMLTREFPAGAAAPLNSVQSPGLRRRLAAKWRRRAVSHREKLPSQLSVAVSVLIYFVGGLAFSVLVDRGFLLFAWLMCGPLGLTIYLARELKHTLLNPYTLFFATLVVLGVAGYVFSH